eukprot:CAMPEP_0194752582 /NCGR_PEP_ID=MMETSP0323_2-20130528/6408_1 /TAXON_ID=2866 ORGANISM="Crypthecodinium cohnii, Strain Seligo" /NCGR_SAMPLE_ID=MMETSP0323_2 /ASSEMBLY_ACC=CAM_ASM_000346 /LENGTH=300 /DNA_ID=CAMNT_0039669647 /DNA_START=45 /DNA_END=947 /DNA_ORIENTATION=-
MPIDFKGRVAIVTGAGNGLGREYALSLATLGAKVVVNDLGTAHSGAGSSSAPADQVVAEIQQMGGEAVANYDSVEDGDKIVKTAVDKWGRVDIVVNNAGILRDVSFKKMSMDDWELIYRVHLKGAFAVTKAAWPYFNEQKYGRIVNVSSPAGLYGNVGQANYATAKRGLVGFTLTLAREGAKNGIKANIIAPVAASRMLETIMKKDMLEKLKPSTVAKLVTFLSSEGCPETGALFEVGGQWMAKLRLQRSKGVAFDANFTVDDIAARFDEICDFRGGAEFPDSGDSLIRKALATGGGAKL